MQTDELFPRVSTSHLQLLSLNLDCCHSFLHQIHLGRVWLRITEMKEKKCGLNSMFDGF